MTFIYFSNTNNKKNMIFLDHVSRRIINEIEGISRVTNDISGKPPSTIEWEWKDDINQ